MSYAQIKSYHSSNKFFVHRVIRRFIKSHILSLTLLGPQAEPGKGGACFVAHLKLSPDTAHHNFSQGLVVRN